VQGVAPVLPITFFGKVMRECSFDGVRIPVGHKAVGCIGQAWIPAAGIHAEGHRCAGEALATLMLKALGVRMLRRFDWSVGNQDLSPTKERSSQRRPAGFRSS
jgi:hypothetical protein